MVGAGLCSGTPATDQPSLLDGMDRWFALVMARYRWRAAEAALPGCLTAASGAVHEMSSPPYLCLFACRRGPGAALCAPSSGHWQQRRGEPASVMHMHAEQRRGCESVRAAQLATDALWQLSCLGLAWLVAALPCVAQRPACRCL